MPSVRPPPVYQPEAPSSGSLSECRMLCVCLHDSKERIKAAHQHLPGFGSVRFAAAATVCVAATAFAQSPIGLAHPSVHPSLFPSSSVNHHTFQTSKNHISLVVCTHTQSNLPFSPSFATPCLYFFLPTHPFNLPTTDHPLRRTIRKETTSPTERTSFPEKRSANRSSSGDISSGSSKSATWFDTRLLREHANSSGIVSRTTVTSLSQWPKSRWLYPLRLFRPLPPPT
jgi:hypothetical protein